MRFETVFFVFGICAQISEYKNRVILRYLCSSRENHLLRINTLLVSGLILKLSDIEPIIPEFNTELRAIS